jgi:hypothetical protein
MARPVIGRPTAASGAVTRPAPERPIVAKARPDPRAMRLVFGFAGLATLSALATSVITPPPSSADVAQAVVPDPTARPVTHVTRFVQLPPGQTAPPQAAVRQLPAPSPKVVVVTTTRQSGKP